jgi:tetratricopeptide (TPR) repeat protein
LLNASTDPAAAIADLRAAAAQSVLNADELALLGSQLQAIGDAAAAVTEFKAAALSKPNRVSVRLALGRLLMTQGQLDASAEQLLAAAALAPSSGVLRAELERLVAQGALKGSALPAAVLPLSDEPFRLHAPAYEDVQELDRTQRGLQWLALRALSRRDLEGARQTLQQLFAHYPATLKDHLVSADVHMAAGQSGPALHVLDDAVKQFAQQVEVRLARADLHARLREPEQAEPDYRWALEHAERPEQRAAAMRGMARIVAGQGRLFPARTLVEGALLLTPRDPLLHRDLFRILADLKLYDEAQLHLDRAEALGFPPDPQARRQLALARQQAPASH